MTERYQTLDVQVDFRASNIERVMSQIWSLFFDRITHLDHQVDRAVWVCNRFPAWVGVKPGYRGEDQYDEPSFVISVMIGKVDAIRDELREKGLPEKIYRREMEPIYTEYYEWLRSAIKVTLETETISKLRGSLIRGEFGVYSTQIEDLHTSELSEMDWIAGDKLRK
jgi:hypothetical protein